MEMTDQEVSHAISNWLVLNAHLKRFDTENLLKGLRIELRHNCRQSILLRLWRRLMKLLTDKGDALIIDICSGKIHLIRELLSLLGKVKRCADTTL